MIKFAFGENKTEGELTFVERLALDLKMSEIAYDSLNLNKNKDTNEWEIDYGVSDRQNAYKKGTQDTREGNENEKRTLSNFGLGILGANIIAGTNTTNQVLMLFENMLGRVSALSAGGGKSHVYAWTCDQYFSLNENEGQLNIAEILGAKSTDADQLSAKGENVKAIDDMKFIWKMMGIEAVNGEAKYKEGSEKNDYEELEKAYDNKKEEGYSYKGRVITYSLGQRGFVELQARVGSNGKSLDSALNSVTLRVADEADVAALSRTAFILGTGDNKVDADIVDEIINNLQKVQKITVNGDNIAANVSAKTKADLKDNEFTIINGAIICSDRLRDAILKEFNGKGDLKSIDEGSRISNIMRAMYVMQARELNIESVAFIDGQPVSIEAGSQQNNTTDQSSSYNVALVQLEIEHLQNEGKTEDQIKKDFKLDIYNVKESVSSGESTISQIFSRNQVSTLNCGGSATLDVAREVAQTIFGGIAVDIEASSISKVIGQYNKKGEAKRFVVDRNNTTREQIINTGVKTVIDFLTNTKKKDNAGKDVGLLFGAMDMSYNAEVMIKALAQLSKGAFTYEQIVEATKGQTLTQILEYIANKYSGLKQYTNQIQIIDADIAGNHSETVGDMAKTKGKLTFSNESGLRGVNFKSIDMVILDAHNFPSSELLQAIGRAGRNAADWGKDKASVTVYMEQASISSMLQEMQQADEYLQGQGRSLFKNTQQTGNTGRLLNDIIRGNISDTHLIDEIDLLESVSTYKSMQLKSESIMFKARQEAMYILAKETLAEMARKARNSGNMEDAKFLEKLYYQAIHNDESNLFGEDTTDGTMSDPMAQMRDTFMQVLQTAEVYLKQAQKHKFADASINLEFANRLLDIQNMRQEGAFQKLIDEEAGKANPYFESTFAQASREVDLLRGLSPAEDIAKTLIKLSSQLLPTKTNTQTPTKAVTAEQAITVTDSMTAEQKAKAEEYIDTINKDATLSYVNSEGNRVLTEKGKIYAELANKIIMPDKDWDKFIQWLFGMLGISLSGEVQPEQVLDLTTKLWNKNVKDPRTFTIMLDSYSNINYDNMTIEALQSFVNAGYDSGLQQYALQNGYGLPPVQTIELARLGLFLDNNYSNTILTNYNAVNAKFKDIQEQQMIINQNLSGKNKAKFDLLFDGLKNRVGLGVTKNLKTLNNIIDPKLEQISEKGATGIKAAMAQAGIPITADTDTAIANMMALSEKLSPEVREQLFKEMRLSDISKFDNITSILSMPDMDRKLKETDYQTIADILGFEQKESGLAKVFNVAKGMFSMFDKKAQQKEQLYKRYPRLRQLEKEEELETKTKAARTKLIGADPYSQAEGTELTLEEVLAYAAASQETTEKELEENLKASLAVIYPTKDATEMLNRLKGIKDTAFIKYAKVSDFAKEYEQELISIMPFGEVSNKQIRNIGYGSAITRAKDLVEKLGGSQDAQQFVDGLSLGVLSDKDFMKELTKLISKTSKDSRRIKASDIYSNEELAGKINAIYQDRSISVGDKITKLDELMESEYSVKGSGQQDA